jgi:hypothetical protein
LVICAGDLSAGDGSVTELRFTRAFMSSSATVMQWAVAESGKYVFTIDVLLMDYSLYQYEMVFSVSSE